jgi:hypothetical protein
LEIKEFKEKWQNLNYVICSALSIVKLNGKKILWIIAQKLKGESASTIAEIQESQSVKFRGSQSVEFNRSTKNTLILANFLKLAIILEDHKKSYPPAIRS